MRLSNVPTLLILVTLVSCGSDRSVKTEKIAGTYTAEIVFDVPNMTTGKMEGTAKIRDTIFIAPKQNGFEITNKKWRSNNYDMEGWRNLRPGANDGALYSFQATYDPTDNSLNSDPPGMMPTLYIDIKERKLYKGKDRNRAYM